MPVCRLCGVDFQGRRDAKYCRKCRNRAGRRHTEVIALRVSRETKAKFQALSPGRKRKLLAYLRTVLEAGLEITGE